MSSVPCAAEEVDRPVLDVLPVALTCSIVALTHLDISRNFIRARNARSVRVQVGNVGGLKYYSQCLVRIWALYLFSFYIPDTW